MKTKRILALVLVTACALGILAGCGKQNTEENKKGNTKITGTVATDGSTSMEKVIGSLKETFEAENEGITVTYNPTGSGTGITAVAEGRCDIGLSSRNLKDEEKERGLTETVIAYDGIAIIVNPENPVTDLTVEQITKIYTGEITNWKEVGGITPGEETIRNGSYQVQRNFVLVTKKDAKLSDAAQEFFDHITSGDASAVISKAGVVPVK